MKLFSVLVALSTLLSGCTMLDTSTPNTSKIKSSPAKTGVTRERVPGRYALLTPEATGVVAVFEDGGRTMIRFARAVPADLMLVDATGKMLSFDRYDQYAIVPGQYEGIMLRSSGRQSYATTGDPGQVNMPAEAPKTPSSPATAEQPPASPPSPAGAPKPAQKPAKTSAL